MDYSHAMYLKLRWALLGVIWIFIYSIFNSKNRITNLVAYFFVAMIVIGQLISYDIEWRLIGPQRKIHFQNLQHMAVTLAYDPSAYSDDDLKVFHGSSTDVVRKSIEVLKKYKLNVFSDTCKTNEYLVQQFFKSQCFDIDRIFNLTSENTNCNFVLLKGWYQAEYWGVWSSANAEMKINLPKDCEGVNCDLKLFLARLLNASTIKSQKVIVKIDDVLVKEWAFNNDGPQIMTIPLDAKTLQGKTKNVKIQFNIPDAKSPTEVLGVPNDGRVLGIGLSSYQFIKRNTN